MDDIKGLESAGHSYEISGLYADGFNPVMSEKEYIREGFYNRVSWVRAGIRLLFLRLGWEGYIRIHFKTQQCAAHIAGALEQTGLFELYLVKSTLSTSAIPNGHNQRRERNFLYELREFTMKSRDEIKCFATVK